MHQLPPDGLIKTLGQHGTNPPHCGRGESTVSFLGEEFVDVTDGEFRDSLVPEGGQDVHPDHGFIVAECAGSDLVAHDVTEPTVEELGDLDVLALEKKPVVELSTQRLQLLDDHTALL